MSACSAVPDGQEDVVQEDSAVKAVPSSIASPTWGHLMTADEVAGVLRCHISTVYDLANQGRLKAFTLTGNTAKKKRGKKGLRFLASNVNEFISGAFTEWERDRVGERMLRPAPPSQEPSSPSALPLKQATVPPRMGKSAVMVPHPGRAN
jgi:excisionase family DNA binding protein